MPSNSVFERGSGKLRKKNTYWFILALTHRNFVNRLPICEVLLLELRKTEKNNKETTGLSLNWLFGDNWPYTLKLDSRGHCDRTGVKAVRAS